MLNRARAAQAAAQLLAEVPTLPDATRIANDPTGQLGQSAQNAGQQPDPFVLWRAPGTMAGAIDYVRTHLPSGWTVTGTSSAGRVGAGTISRGLELAPPPSDAETEAYSQLRALVQVTPYHGGVVIRTDAQDIALPARTAVEEIPLDASSVDVTITRPNARTTGR